MSDGESDPVSSSSSEEEDEIGKELTLEVEKKFLKTLQSLKTKDPAIYDANVKFFDAPAVQEEINDEVTKRKSKQKKEKPFLLSDYDKLLVKSGGEIKEEPDVLPSYNEEQEEIKSNLKKALLESDDSDEEGSSLLMLKPKSKSTETENSATSDEETEIKHWLTGTKSELKNKHIEQELKPLHDIWTNPELDDGETYLRDYILNKRYLDDTGTEANKSNTESDDQSSSSDDFDSKQEEFEHKFNFRFEEPDQEFIKRYPRTMEASMRRKESKRKMKREQAKKNKEDKVERKREEMKKLRRAKREEILSHLNNLKSITGNETLAFKEEMLGGEFNPDEHDKIMQSMFNEEFYAGQEDEKPVFQDDEDFDYPEVDNVEDGGEYEGDYPKDLESQDYSGEAEHEDPEDATQEEFTADGELITDCDYDPSQAGARGRAGGRKLGRAKLKRLMRREKRGAAGPGAAKSLFAQAAARPKPAFNPQDKTFVQYVDEYYGLEFEDLIGGDLPCRFKYKRVVPNSYGLSIDEILAADDKELNKWCPVKKIYSQRAEHVERNEVRVYTQRSTDEQLKRKLLPSLFKPPDEGEEEEETQRILPTEEERRELMSKKQKKIQQISEQFEQEKQLNPTTRSNAEQGIPEKDDLVDEAIVNEYLKEKRKAATKAKSNKRKLREATRQAVGNDKDNQAEVIAKKKRKVKNTEEKVAQEVNFQERTDDTSDDKVVKKEKVKVDKSVKKVNTVDQVSKDKTKDDKSNGLGKKKKLKVNKTVEKVSTVDEVSNDKTKDAKSNGLVKKKKAKSDESVKPETNKTNKKVTKDNCDNEPVQNGTQIINQNGDKKKKKRKRKKKKKKSEETAEESKEEDVNKSKKNKKKAGKGEVGSKDGDKKKKALKRKINDKQVERRKNLKKKLGHGGDRKDVKVTEFSDARLKAYGINPKKFKSKLLYGNKDKSS